MRKQLNSKMSGSTVSGIMLGLVSGVGVLICGAILIAWLISAEYIGEGSSGYGIAICMLLGGFLSALLIIGSNSFSKLVAATISATGLLAILLLMNLLLGVGSVSGIIETALVVLAGSACAIFINPHKKTRVRYRFKK